MRRSVRWRHAGRHQSWRRRLSTSWRGRGVERVSAYDATSRNGAAHVRNGFELARPVKRQPATLEELMEYNVFEEPVTLIVGLGFPTQVRTVAEAYALLGEWHSSKTDPARTLAINACRAALSGEIEAQTARGLFVAFAHKHDLLAPGHDEGASQGDAGERARFGVSLEHDRRPT